MTETIFVDKASIPQPLRQNGSHPLTKGERPPPASLTWRKGRRSSRVTRHKSPRSTDVTSACSRQSVPIRRQTAAHHRSVPPPPACHPPTVAGQSGGGADRRKKLHTVTARRRIQQVEAAAPMRNRPHPRRFPFSSCAFPRRCSRIMRAWRPFLGPRTGGWG
jgi:hypothetical protein